MGLRFYIFAAMMIAVILIFLLWQTISEDIIDQRFFFLFYSIPSNLAISVFPHEPLLLYLGKTQSAFLLAVIGAIGTIIAGFIDYFVFVPLLAEKLPNSIRQSNWNLRAVRWFNYQPFLTITVAGFSPVPFLPFKYLAFTSRYPLPKYIGSLVIGRAPRYYLLALSGKMLSIPDWVILSAFITMLSFIVYNSYPHFVYLWRRKRHENE